jgi:hypothetical protein
MYHPVLRVEPDDVELLERLAEQQRFYELARVLYRL